MRFSVYMTAEGLAFDPEAFNRSLPQNLRGEVRERRRMRVRPDGPERLYWQSMQVDTEQNPEDALSALVSDLMVPLKRIASADSVKVSAQIVARKTEQDDARGFYAPPSLVSMLAELHADLDIDVVHDLQHPSIPSSRSE